MTWSLPQLKAALGGEIAGQQINCPGPGHSARDRSLSVKPSPTARGGFVVFSHSPQDTMAECRDYVADRLGLGRWQPERDRVEDVVARMAARRQRAEAELADEADRQDRIDYAAKVFGECGTILNTISATYLGARLLDPERAAATLRHHSRGPWGKGARAPMMVAPMYDIRTRKFCGIHRTGLTLDGQKLDRKMLGPIRDAAIMLTPDSETLVAGEGVESCLSALQLGYGPTVWSMGSAGALGRLPVLDRFRRLVLLEERDAASANAVSDAGNRWSRAGKAVSVVLPTTGKDLNDSLRGIA